MRCQPKSEDFLTKVCQDLRVRADTLTLLKCSFGAGLTTGLVTVTCQEVQGSKIRGQDKREKGRMTDDRGGFSGNGERKTGHGFFSFGFGI